MAIEIVPVTQENVEQAIAVACQVFDTEIDHNSIRQELRAAVGLEPEETNVEQIIQIERDGYIMALVDGKPAGVSGFYSHIGHEQDAWLGWTAVDKDHCGMGIGRKLVTEAFARASDIEGVENLRIWTSDEDKYAEARRLYASMGFDEESYRAGATDGASMVRVFTKPAKSNGVSRAWAQVAYPLLDLELYEMPRLNMLAASKLKAA